MSNQLYTFLKSEYEQAGQKLVTIHLCDRTYVIPYPYVRDEEDYSKAFLSDLFGSQSKDYRLYQRHNIPARYISWSNGNISRRLIVPFDLRNKQVSASVIAQRIFNRADKIYNKAVRLAYKLSLIYPDRRYQTVVNMAQINIMQKAYYEYQLKNERQETDYLTKKVGRFFSKNAQKISHNLEKISIPLLKDKARRWGLRKMLTATVSAAVYNAVKKTENLNNDPTENTLD